MSKENQEEVGQRKSPEVESGHRWKTKKNNNSSRTRYIYNLFSTTEAFFPSAHVYTYIHTCASALRIPGVGISADRSRMRISITYSRRVAREFQNCVGVEFSVYKCRWERNSLEV